jgi:predicted  nucleic acid-binding Zn-ribbon protein
MARHLDTVVVLQQALDQLQALDESLAGVPPEMRELHDEHTERKAEMDALEATIAEAEAVKRAAEVTTQDFEVKLKHYQEQVNRVKTQREYSAILQEIDLVKEHTRDLEEQTLAAMETQEEAETTLGELRPAFETLDAQYAEESAKWEIAKPGVAQQAESTRAHIAELREEIPASTRLLFERVRERSSGSTLAEVLPVKRNVRGPSMWHCGACHYNVRPQSVVDITNNGNVILCDSCKRILYISESED